MLTATPSTKQQPLALFGLTEEEHQLLQQVAKRPRRSAGFSPDAVCYLMRRHLVRAYNHGRTLAITLAGLGTAEAIEILS